MWARAGASSRVGGRLEAAAEVAGMTLQVGIYVYEQVEVLDFAGPYEVFTTASRVHQRIAPGQPPPFAVALVAERPGPVAARAGFTVVPQACFDDHPPLDLLLVPGGVHEAELGKRRVVEWIRAQAGAARLTSSVCTGAFLLAQAGLLGGLAVTTHWEDVEDLRRQFPGLEVREGVRWIEHERVVTSAGISAGLDMALRLVARFSGQALAERTARQMDYAWQQRG
jgi:transcriptional regulator GlxA family with amidase domain